MPSNSVLDALQGIRGRVRWIALLFGGGLCAATAVGLLLALVFFDWALVLPVVARAALLVGVVGGVCVAIHHWMVRPAVSALSLSDIAGRIEHTFPQFDDRLRSTVDFSRADVPGSEALKQRVISQATQLAQQVNLRDVIRLRPMWYSLAGGAGSVLLVAALLLFGSRPYVDAALDRLAMGNRAWPKTVEIALDDPLPQRVAVGDRIPVRIHLTKGDRTSRKAFIYYRYDQGPWQQELMTRADGFYTAALDARLDQGQSSGRISVRLESGDDERELPPILIVPRLETAGIEAQVLPPPYVKPRRPSTVNLVERPVVVVGVGSDVAIRITFTKPLAADKPVELLPAVGTKLPASASSIIWERPADNVAVARLVAADPMRFTIHATDIDGFENSPGSELELSVREDQPPTVQIEEPRRSEDRTPDAEFDVKAVAEDDYGIDNAQLVVHRFSEQNNSQQNQWVIDLVKDGAAAANSSWELTDSTMDHQRYRLGYHWVLQSLAGANLKPGDVLEFFIQVKDNFDLNGKQHDWVPSGGAGRLRAGVRFPQATDRGTGSQQGRDRHAAAGDRGAKGVRQCRRDPGAAPDQPAERHGLADVASCRPAWLAAGEDGGEQVSRRRDEADGRGCQEIAGADRQRTDARRRRQAGRCQPEFAGRSGDAGRSAQAIVSQPADLGRAAQGGDGSAGQFRRALRSHLPL
jgi:hypothetical protein